jgi:hypothetical protein
MFLGRALKSHTQPKNASVDSIGQRFVDGRRQRQQSPAGLRAIHGGAPSYVASSAPFSRVVVRVWRDVCVATQVAEPAHSSCLPRVCRDSVRVRAPRRVRVPRRVHVVDRQDIGGAVPIHVITRFARPCLVEVRVAVAGVLVPMRGMVA